jgi:23S rRNA (uracil1939-C5)-methyltransferase
MLLTVEKLIYGGDGLARTPAAADGRSMAVFLPFVLPGERVEAAIAQEKPGFARGQVTQLVEPSSERVAARCPYFQQCGGCHYQHIVYEAQLRFKADILRETLRRVAKIEFKDEIKTHASPPWNYRNRTRLQVQTAPEFTLGYFRLGSHEVLPVRECPISSPLINRVMARLLELQGCNCPAEVEEIELFVDAADMRLLAWSFCGRGGDRKQLLSWAETLRREVPEIAGVSLFPSRRRSEDEPAADVKAFAYVGDRAIQYRVGQTDYRVSAGAFFQINRHLVEEFVAVVGAKASGGTALDLYAGVGLFAAALARSFHHIFAVEASLISQADLTQNVPANVKAVGTRTEDYLRGQPVRTRPDLVVLDPPRTGLGKTVSRWLADLKAPGIRYVSCDPATLARDLAPMLASGYRIEEAHLFDLFPGTYHIESVMLLAR